jgi:Nucleotidyltransferase of unknown function (DUF6036)
MSPDFPSPWREFLGELDALLDERIQLHCIGGFALVAGYGLPRSTNDLDYRSLVPYNRINDLQRMAGPGSALARKYKVHVQYTGVESIPENYDERLTELCAGSFKNIRLFVPDAYDLVLSKLSRNIERDRQDVEFLAKTRHLDPMVLRERYETELRSILIGPPSQHDATLKFWLEAYFAASQS